MEAQNQTASFNDLLAVASGNKSVQTSVSFDSSAYNIVAMIIVGLILLTVIAILVAKYA